MRVESGLEAWSEFGVAIAGATAALAGLIIVAISVNVEIIVASRALPSRAAAAIGVLVLACIAGCLMLIPGTPTWLYGVEVLIGTAIAWVLAAFALVRLREDKYGSRAVKGLLVVVPAIVFAVGGILLVGGAAAGMPVIAFACIASVIAAVIVSWVTLIEVRR